MAFVTGNLLNMKVPAAQVSLRKAGVNPASDEGEVPDHRRAISTIVTNPVLCRRAASRDPDHAVYQKRSDALKRL